MALTNKAAKGNVPAIDKLIALMIQAFGLEEQRSEKKSLTDTQKLILSQLVGDDTDSAGQPIEAVLYDPGTGPEDGL